MRTEPIIIDGLAGPVAVTTNALTGSHSITVGGQPAPGTRRGRYTLPTADGGTVDARLRVGVLDTYPTIEISGVKHRTGPPAPVALRILGLLPLVLVAGGLLGGLIGGTGVLINLAIARGALPTAAKTVLMIVVFAIAAMACLLVVAAIQTNLQAA